jgi:hypothetical protein
LLIREIHTIFGGLAGGGESSTRKAHGKESKYRESISSGKAVKNPRERANGYISEDDAEGISMPRDDPLVVTMTVANHTIHRILIDNGSSADILYWSVIQQMGINQDMIKPFGSPFVGFTREQVQTIRLISLPVTVGTSPRQSTIMVDILVVN